MSKFEVYVFVEGTRELIFMALDEHGILCADGHWMTAEEVISLPEAEVIDLFNQIYGRD